MSKRFPTGGGKFSLPGLTAFTQRPGTFTDAQIKKMCENFAAIGLDCEANNPDKMREYIAEIEKAIFGDSPTEERVFVGSLKNKAKPYEFTFDDGPEKNYTKMHLLAEHMDDIDKNHLYYVETHTEEQNQELTVHQAIMKALTAMGSAISKVSARIVDPGQIMSLIGDFILNKLPPSKSKNLETGDSGILFAFVDPGEGSTIAPAICGISYRFDLKIEDYLNEKEKTHQAHYSIKQENIYFSDETIFQEIYTKITERK